MQEYIFDIFEDITCMTVARMAHFLRQIPDKCRVLMQICSYGGSVFDGIAVMQMIQVSRKFGAEWTARVYGLAASSAADIVLSCGRVEMAQTASLMIHSAWNVDGAHDDGIRAANAAQLSVIKKRLPEYTEKDLDHDRWFRADEALEMGLIDSIFDSDDDARASSLAAKYMAKYKISHGGAEMEEQKKEKEVIEEKAEEVIEEKEVEKSPSYDDVLEKIAERLEAIERRLGEHEEILRTETTDVEQAACGDDDRVNARLKAVYDRIQAVLRPAQPKPQKAHLSPEDEMKRIKAKYPDLDRIIDRG